MARKDRVVVEASWGGDVIVADDSSLIRSLLRVTLEPAWRMFQADNGETAIDYAQNLQARLVILDINMHPLNGIEAARHIRRLPSYATVPLLMLTAYDSPANRDQALAAGANHLLAKPFSAQQLQAAIRDLIGKLADPEPNPTPGAWLSSARDSLAIYRRVDAISPRMPAVSFIDLLKSRHPRWDR